VNGRRAHECAEFVAFDDKLKIIELRELTRIKAARSERTAFFRGYPCRGSFGTASIPHFLLKPVNQIRLLYQRPRHAKILDFSSIYYFRHFCKIP
jgi:hypothetical protein